MPWPSLPSLRRRQQSVVVGGATERFGASELNQALKSLGEDGVTAKQLDRDVDVAMRSITSLSVLTAPLALQYMDRLGRPIPSLTPELGVELVGRVYVAHMVVEGDPARYGAPDVPVLGTLPPMKKGAPPQDLLSRVVKVSRRSFPPLCALTPAAWEGFVKCVTKRSHDLAAKRVSDNDVGYIPEDVVDGLARFAWILRQVDLHYGFEPDRQP